MDVRFLKEIGEAYIIDTGKTNLTSEEVFNELYNISKILQSNDILLYEELYASSRLAQQKILKTYLDFQYNEYNEINYEILDEEIATGAGLTLGASVSWPMALSGGLIFLIGSLYRKQISKAIFKTAAILGKGLDTFGQWISKHGKYSQLRYSIIQENAKKCYVKCGIENKSDISSLSYLTVSTSGSMGTKISLEQSECLRECYIEQLIETIALHMEGYFACLKRTGNLQAIQKTESDDLIKMIQSTNIGATCMDYYDLAKEALDNFYKVLDLVYDQKYDDSKKLHWVNQLRDRMYRARNDVTKLNDNQVQRYDNRNFQSNNSGNKPNFQKH